MTGSAAGDAAIAIPLLLILLSCLIDAIAAPEWHVKRARGPRLHHLQQ
jgi:hypothetical protein